MWNLLKKRTSLYLKQRESLTDRKPTSRSETKAKSNQITRTFERGCGYLVANRLSECPAVVWGVFNHNLKTKDNEP